MFRVTEMRTVGVHAFEDRDRPEGGHAIVVLQGVQTFPDDAVYSILPAGDVGGELPEGWPAGSHLPISRRTTDAGTELVVGPEVTGSELMLPGTVVAIEIPAAGVRGEFVWPDVPPLRRPRRNVLGVTPRSAYDVDTEPIGEAAVNVVPPPIPAAAASIPTVPPPLPVTAYAAPGASDGYNPPASAGRPASEAAWATAAPVEGAPVDAGRYHTNTTHGEHGHDAVQHRSRADGSDGDADDRIDLPPARAEPLFDSRRFVTSHMAHVAADDEAVRHTARDRVAASADSNPGARAQTEPAAARVPARTDAMSGTTEAIYEAQATLSRLRQSMRSDDAGGRAGRIGDATYQTTASNRNERSRSAMEVDYGRPKASSAKMAIGAGLAALIGAVGAVLLLAPERVLGPRAAHVERAAAPGSFDVQAGARAGGDAALIADDDIPDAVFDSLSTGNVSPRGVPAADVPRAKMLENANKSGAGGSAAEREEGAYWRKRYVNSALGSDRTRKALTQLGSLYAEPSSQPPDYTKARLLWEIASAAGDSVAMCFLGQLHENGLSVTQDKKLALQWYERAKAAGGCSSADEAIQRLRQ